MATTILSKEVLIPGRTSKLLLAAPEIAAAARPGHFVMLRVSEKGERIPLTIADTDSAQGTITIVYLVMGKTTAALDALKEGDTLRDLCGPLGRATRIEKCGTVICVGGGTGIAAMHHIARGHHQAGNKTVVIIGARTRELLLFEKELQRFADEILIATDDGSYGHKGLVTELLEQRLKTDQNVGEVVAVGPVPMMDAVARTTRPFGVKTIVSLNSIMVDGMGMCGACRVTVGGETRFTCVDGPEFDGHQVDFAELKKRLGFFRELENQSMTAYQGCSCGHETETRAEKPGRVPMPQQSPEERRKNFHEVALGYTPDMAFIEASRCLNCKKPRCMSGCPVEVPIPAFIHALTEGDVEGAYGIIKSANSLPAICGRVCPQENQCEGKCVLGVKGEPVAIGRLERFVADEMARRAYGKKAAPGKTGAPEKKVACIGSGPSSLTAAGYLAARGCQVTVFEALHEPGGVLVYGIPEFRLPKAGVVAREIAGLRELGVNFVCNAVGGRTFHLKDLFTQGYKAIFLGLGAGLPRFMDVPGENLNGVFSANEYLTRVNLGRAYDFPHHDTPIIRGKKITVFGGGNVAMDAARTGLRLGAQSVRIVYRRSEEAMPARREEREHAVEEGVIMECLAAPLAFLPGEDGNLAKVRLQRMELGEPDASGRRSPVPIQGAEYELETDLAVIAVGTRANPVLLAAEPELKLNSRGYIEADPKTGETSMPNVFAGGDIVTGAATVILAMGAGRAAAREIARRLGCSDQNERPL